MTKRQRITSRARGFLRSTRAVSALEYAILVGVIVVAVVRLATQHVFGTSDLKTRITKAIRAQMTLKVPQLIARSSKK